METRPAPGDRLFRLVAVLFAVIALLGLVMFASRNGPFHLEQEGTGRPSPVFVDYVWTTLVLVAAVALALLLYAVSQVPRRPGAAPRDSRWLKSIAAFCAFVCTALVILKLAHVDERLREAKPRGISQPNQRIRQLPQIPEGARTARFRWEEAAVAAGILALATGAYLIRRRRDLAEPPGEPAPSATAELAALVGESMDDLRREPDPRRAIIAAYARMERTLAANGLPRRAAEAPLEYLERTLSVFATSAQSVRRLTLLFEWAKFSDHQPHPSMRAEAIEALAALRRELQAMSA